MSLTMIIIYIQHAEYPRPNERFVLRSRELKKSAIAKRCADILVRALVLVEAVSESPRRKQAEQLLRVDAKATSSADSENSRAQPAN